MIRGCIPLLVAVLAAGSPSPSAPAPATLEVENRPVATFRVTVAGVDPAERVRAAQQRIDALPPEALDQPVTIRPVSLGDEHGFAVLVGSRLSLFFADADADALAEETPERAAAAVAERLAEALRAERDQRSVKVVLRGLGETAAATALLLLLLWALRRLRRLIEPFLSGVANKEVAAVRGGRIDLGPVVTAAVRSLLFAVFWGMVALLLYAWVTFVLGRFPLTLPWAQILGSRVISFLGAALIAILRALPGLVTVAVILVVARFVANFSDGVFLRAERGGLAVPGVFPETASATRRIVKAVIWLAALAAAYPYIPGSSSDAVKGLSVLVGVMLSLGATGLVSQAMSGLAVIYSRALTVGDTVRLGDVEGVVSEVGLLSTKLVCAGREVTFPNSVVIGGAVTNYTRLSRATGPLVTTVVTIGYDAPWRQVQALLVGAASQTDGLRRDPAPFVLQRSLGDFYVEYELLAQLEGDATVRPRVLSDLHANVQDAFNAAGVQIMSPHFVLQPEGAVVVPRERWEGQAAPPPTGRRRR
jgi:small-conductance mechanosensitive channel